MRTACILCVTLALVSCGPKFTEGELTPNTVAQLDAAVASTHADLGAPGVLAYLEVPGRGRWIGRAGVADPSGAPMSTDRPIRIGSVTKTFTSTIFLRLVDEKIVGIDDPVSRWVPGVPNGDRITLRQLASMTAGLASYTFDDGFQSRLFQHPDDFFTPDELLEYGFSEQVDNGCTAIPEQCFEPGTRFFYSNTNTILLARALEAATKKSYSDLLTEYVTEPLGLRGTFQPRGTSLPERACHGITIQGLMPGEKSRDATNWNPSWGFAAGDLVSTVDDLVIYARALGSGSLLSEESKRARFTKLTMPPNSPDHAYAIGIGYTHGWWGHTGELPGYNTVVYYRPDIDAVLVVSATRDESEVDGKLVGPAAKLAEEIVDIAAKELGLVDLDTPEHEEL